MGGRESRRLSRGCAAAGHPSPSTLPGGHGSQPTSCLAARKTRGRGRTTGHLAWVHEVGKLKTCHVQFENLFVSNQVWVGRLCALAGIIQAEGLIALGALAALPPPYLDVSRPLATTTLSFPSRSGH